MTHTFPTRRLPAPPTGWSAWKRPVRLLRRPERLSNVVALLPDHPPRRFVWRGQIYRVVAGDGPERIHGEWRSEEHTSELQSLMRISYAVFCLKKKNIHNINTASSHAPTDTN